MLQSEYLRPWLGSMNRKNSRAASCGEWTRLRFSCLIRSHAEADEGSFHVINRDNHRNCVFETDGAKQFFEKCLNTLRETKKIVRSTERSTDWKLAITSKM